MKSNVRSNWMLALVTGVLVSAAVLGGSVSVASADGATCGTKEKGPCPLQKWMRDNMGPPAAAGDTGALAVALSKAATMSPDPGWTWTKIAADGAEAAKKGDLTGAKASCKSCHDAYKEKFKAQFRTNPVK